MGRELVDLGEATMGLASKTQSRHCDGVAVGALDQVEMVSSVRASLDDQHLSHASPFIDVTFASCFAYSIA